MNEKDRPYRLVPIVHQVTQKMNDHAKEIPMPKTVTLKLNGAELFLIQEMMRDAKANPFHSDDYRDEETEKLIHKITDALNETYE